MYLQMMNIDEHKTLQEFQGKQSTLDVAHKLDSMPHVLTVDRYFVPLSISTSKPVNYKEAITATRAVIRWAPVLQNRNVYVYMVYVDNQCAVSIINKHAPKDDGIMSLLRQILNCS